MHIKQPLTILLGLMLAAPLAHAEIAKLDSLDLSLEELMNLVVTSVSKKAQTLAETSAAAYVIKAEDIRRSGATNIPEALRLAPGVQVAAIGQNRWAITIRGFNSRFANKLLVLVDGRAIYSPAFSGVYWEHNDIPIENIERIEVIRGPGGSLWGANAVNGIINILTYSAKDTQGGLLSAAAGDELKGMGMARYGWALDDETYLRLHATGKSVDGGEAVAGGDGPDYWKSKQAGFRLDTKREGDSYSLQGALSDYEAGDSITGFTPGIPYFNTVNTDGAGKTAHLLGKWERPTDTGSHSLQAFIDHTDNNMGVARYRNDTFDLEYQRQITGDTHDLVWGLGYRVSKDRVDSTQNLFFATDSRKTFSLFSAFIQDEITLVPERWRLTLGSRFEHNDFTGLEVQPNVRLLWTPSQQDSLWAAVSRAVRTPSRGELASTVFIAPPTFDYSSMPPSMLIPAIATVGDPNMQAEKLTALDLGWRRQWHDTLSSDVAAFYYRYADLRGGVPGAPLVLGTDPYLPLYVTNAIGAESYGLEASLDWMPQSNWRLQANVSLFQINSHDAELGANDSEFIGASPSHQIFLRSSLDITSKLQWDVWLRHVGKLSGGSLSNGCDVVPAYTSLDMRLAWKPQRDMEIALVGQNLLDSSHPEFVTLSMLSAQVNIQRGVYLKADWKF